MNGMPLNLTTKELVEVEHRLLMAHREIIEIASAITNNLDPTHCNVSTLSMYSDAVYRGIYCSQSLESSDQVLTIINHSFRVWSITDYLFKGHAASDTGTKENWGKILASGWEYSYAKPSWEVFQAQGHGLGI